MLIPGEKERGIFMDFYCRLINREYPLERDYIPDDLIPCDFPFAAAEHAEKRLLRSTAAQAAKALIEYGKSFGCSLYGISGYRSYARQQEIYEKRLAQAGLLHTARYIARPGESEHQSGLALDLSCPAVSLELEESFAETWEGRWLAAYAPMFGFILRYPRGKEKITGYAWEPWHIRYVGKSLALYLALTGMTLEEYHRI